jgi:threonine/homoserine/homoserine lactone efflux protein
MAVCTQCRSLVGGTVRLRQVSEMIVPPTTLAAFGAVAVSMVLTPGPNMAYLVSRSICQGRVAGLVSLGGVAMGFVTYMLCAAFDITALLFAVPYGYDALRLAGAAYLAWMAWNALKPAICRPIRVSNSLGWGS